MSPSRIHELWRQYVDQELDTDLSSLRPEVRDSWRRCRKRHVDFSLKKPPSVDGDDFERRKNDSRELIESAIPYLHKLFKIINDDESIITLTDLDGVVLETLSSDLMHAMPSFPGEGTVHNETAVGTSGIGTSLALDVPIQLQGAEHWLQVNHAWVCNTSPVHISNNVVGCVNLACPLVGQYHAHTLGLVVATANAIERDIMLNRVLKEKQIILQQQKLVLDVVDTGIITIDYEGIVRQINQQALDVFGVGGEWVGRPLSELIHTDVDFLQIMHHGEMLEECDIPVMIGSSHRHLSCSTFRIGSDRMGTGMIIRLRTTGVVRNLVNKVSGARAFYTFNDVICASNSMEQPMKIARLASKNAMNVLVMGETGTGKELLVQAIHNASERKNGPFIAINCGALSRELIQSELFGYEGGSFTGAKMGGSLGKFELADGGTLFLDEIAELPLEVQVNLLRVLQTRSVMRIGGKHALPVDVRVIAATNRDLEQAVQEMTFREDLYYRLNVLAINLPPLRERRSDIRLLTDHLLHKITKQFDVQSLRVSDEVYELFDRYPWPGNIRELENVLQRAVVLAENGVVELRDLPLAMRQQSALASCAGIDSFRRGNPSTDIGSVKRDHLIRVLVETSGNLRKTAVLLGVSRGTVYSMVKRWNIDIGSFRT